MQSKTVLVVGATGMLGHLVALQLVARGADVRVLLRTGHHDLEKRERIDSLAMRGVRVMEGDIQRPDTLRGALDGVAAVVSAVQGDERVIVDGQENLLREAEAAGVTRLIPSDYSIDFTRLDYGDNLFLDLRKRAAERFAGSRVEIVPVLNGAFHNTIDAVMGLADWSSGTFAYWGDPGQRCDFTSVEDTARYTAAVALDPETLSGPVRVAGDVLALGELKVALERGSGRALVEQRMGSADDLLAEIARLKLVARHPFEYVRLQYVWAMVSGKAKLHPLDNGRYPDIQPMSVEEYVRVEQRALVAASL